MGTIIIALIIRIIHTAKQMGLITAGIVVAIIFVGIFLLASALQVRTPELRSLVSLSLFDFSASSLGTRSHCTDC